MAELSQVYKCETCGNIVMIVQTGGNPNCCGDDMKLMEIKTEDEGQEKHVPIITITGNKVVVAVGSVPHPMEEKHFIQFVQLLQKGRIVAMRQLKPGEKPEAMFCLDNTDDLTARELCNIHGLWTNK